MLFNEEIKEQISPQQLRELNIKLKTMEKTEKNMIDKLKFMLENIDKSQNEKLYQTFKNIISSFQFDFKEKWFK